ncbi:MAG: S8 family serine peptidase [Ignavibacteriaceae bacterium]|nr:S8 family serine peptidase [Ignavibacteriaceae bacterium]
MRIFFRTFLFISILFVSNLFAQNYYFVEGKRIELNERRDKFAIILNQTVLDESVIELQLRTTVGLSFETKKMETGIYIVNLPTQVEESFIEDKINALNNLSEIVKFATKVYYGESKKVTQIPTDEFIVRLNDLGDKYKLDELNSQYKCEIIRNIGDEKGFLIKSKNNVPMNALTLSDIYFQTRIFDYCEPDFGYPEGCLFNYDPNDANYPSQWPLKNTGQSTPTEGNTTAGDLTNSAGIPGADMDISKAWDYVKGNNNVIIGVFDTGVDSLHPDLSQNLIAGYDAHLNKYGVSNDPGSHGTCTAGIIGARTNNSIGVAGIVGGDNTANSNCKIMSFKIVNNLGNFTTSSNIARAFDTARVKGVYVSSNSWGGGSVSSTLNSAINNFANNGRGGLGSVVLFSSGNDGKNPPNYPSYLASVVCVGASTRHDQKKAAGSGNQWWWGGNYGEDVNGDIDLVAPTICYTTDIRSTGGYNTTSGSGGDYYATFNGTSAACPNAAGVVALIFSVNPSLTRSQVLDYLYRGCEKIDNVGYTTSKTYGSWNEYFGYGRVNAFNSVRLAVGVDVTPPTIVHTVVQSHSSTYPTTITATIFDQDGSSVPTSGNQRPKIFYRFNKNGAGWTSFDSAFAVSNTGNLFTFKIPCVGRQTEVQYYLKAQDNNGNTAKFPFHASASYPYTLCYFGVGNITTETRSLSNWSPPDNGAQISSNVNFPNSFAVLEASVKINLSHTYVSDIMLILWASDTDADRNRICLFSYNGGSGDNISNATVTDIASQFWSQSAPPYSNGFYKPEYLLEGLKGTNAQGNWKFINDDAYLGDAPTYTSLDIILKKMNGVTSSSARLNSAGDSILNFGNVIPPIIVEKDFYLKNVGNANLTISAVNFTGTYASKFSLVNSAPTSIAPGDSGLFRVRLTHNAANKSLDGGLEPELFQNALMEISNNDPSKSIFRVSLETDSPVPVELSSFTASVVGNSVNLNWQTQTEVNNYGFEIERRADNLKSGSWEKIGFIAGSGNSNSPKNYSFTDKPDQKLHKAFSYRLKQIDNDGKFEYSKTVEVDLSSPQDFTLYQNYPNPFNPVTNISFRVKQTQKVILEVFDMLGNKIEVLFNSTAEGGKLYNIEFNAEDYATGTYFYKLNSNEGVSVRKMILIK